MRFSFKKWFYAIATIFALFAALVLAKLILMPLSVALLMSFILLPLVKKLESWRMNKIFSAFFSIASVILLLGAITMLFSSQIMELSKEFIHFKEKIIRTFTEITLYINNNINPGQDLEKDELFNRIKAWLQEATGPLVRKTFDNTSTFLTGLLATIIYTFLILIYRDGLKHALISFSPAEHRQSVENMFKSVQQVGKKYLVGMILLIGIIGLFNSIGLWIIGIDNPFFFGFLGAALSIIPYIGTTLGAIIPALYAFVSFDSPWIAIAVIILFWAVQLVSDNLLTPKIVGGSLKINALTTLLSLIIGAVVWGVAGMILFLPFAAMLKVCCEEYDELRPIALLIGTYDDNESTDHNNAFDKAMVKLRTWFNKTSDS
jgi:predicted PurR-regulated permease PerM